nr:MAG TPA: hypothetical protein [Caudoviricetes sp.]
MPELFYRHSFTALSRFFGHKKRPCFYHGLNY